MKTERLPIVLVALSAFLAPLLGGYVAADPLPLLPGADAFLRGLNGPELPVLAHVLVALPAVAALVLAVARRSVLPLPPPTFAIPMGALLAVLVVSVGVSAYRSVSMLALVEWALYGLAAVAAVVVSGRRQGPKLILSAFVAGCALVAVLGILEYGAARASDPSWRVFSVWMNPNALAGVLGFGALVGFGLTLQEERLPALAAGAATTLALFALLLTQSKGAYLTTGLGLLVFVVLGLVSPTTSLAPRMGRLALVLAVVVCMAIGLGSQQKSPSGIAAAPGVFSRIENASAQSEQSGAFRVNLWRSAIELMRRQPVGFGLGSFAYESARPGLVTKTHMAHNSYLQLGAEASPLAPLLLLFAGLAWCGRFLKGARRAAPEVGWLRAGLFAAVVGVGAHATVDSDLHYFGIGFAFFLAIGLGFDLSLDGPSPEFVPRPHRFAALALIAFVPIMGLFLGQIEATKSRVRGAALVGDRDAVQSGLDTLAALAPAHGDTWYLRALMLGTSDEERRGWLERAARLAPTGRHLRAYAQALSQQGDQAGAVLVYREALVHDPNDLETLERLRLLYVGLGNPEEAVKIARRTVAIEGTPYFQTRSLPELVPTQTFRARLFLADQGEEATEHLVAAVRGYRDYLARTVPQVMDRIRKGEPTGAFAGEDRDSVAQNLATAEAAARGLAKRYRASGSVPDAEGAERDAAAFAEALAALAGAANSAGSPSR
ncbi:MAG: O-antigen ligase family protein [Fimbriimonadaceae bacterium]|nr:O-antigen ligase family protein [Fimbriimonadaceae bacterium]